MDWTAEGERARERVMRRKGDDGQAIRVRVCVLLEAERYSHANTHAHMCRAGCPCASIPGRVYVRSGGRAGGCFCICIDTHTDNDVDADDDATVRCLHNGFPLFVLVPITWPVRPGWPCLVGGMEV